MLARILPVVGHDLFRILGARIRHRKTEGEDVVGADAEIDAEEIPEAVNGETRTGEERQCQGKLANYENPPQAVTAGSSARTAALLQSLCGIDPGGIPCRNAAKEQPGNRCRQQGEEQDRNVQVKVRFGWQCPLGHDRYQPGEHGISDANSKDAAHQGEQEAFGKQLNEDGPRSCPQRAADGQLFLPGHAAGQQEIGDVDAGDQEHKSDRAQQQPQGQLSLLGQEVVFQRLDPRAPSLVALRILLRDVGGDRVHIGLRLLDGDARLQSAHNQQPVEVVIDLVGFEDQWHGQLCVIAIVRTGRKHADDGIGLSVHGHGGADDVWIGAEFQPQLVGQDDDVVFPFLAFLG